MILDERVIFAKAAPLDTGSPGTVQIGDTFDLKASTITPNTSADADDLFCVIRMDTSAASGGAATGQFHVVSDAQSALAVDGSATHHLSTGAIPYALMTAGTVLAAFKLPPGRYERYLGLLQTTGGAALTAGKVNAFLTSDPALWRKHADNIT